MTAINIRTGQKLRIENMSNVDDRTFVATVTKGARVFMGKTLVFVRSDWKVTA